MPPIKHNPQNDLAFEPSSSQQPSESNVVGQDEKTLHNQKILMKCMKRVRFSEPIALYEPMTNTLRNRIIHDNKISVSSGNPFELKSALKGGGLLVSRPPDGQPQPHGDGSGPLNSTIMTINTMNNTMSNKASVNSNMSKAMHGSMIAGRPISAPVNGLKKIADGGAVTTQPPQQQPPQQQQNPLLSSRDQIVKKSLMELQTRIVSNLASLSEDQSSREADGANQQSKDPSHLPGTAADNNLLFSSSLATLQNNGDLLGGPGNNRFVDDSKRPKSASFSDFQSGRTTIDSMKTFTPSLTSQLPSHIGASSSGHGGNEVVPENMQLTRGAALFNLMAKSILIGNYSCRVVNNIQFYADHFEFLFPILDFSQNSGAFSSTTSSTGAGSNYSSLKALTIYYRDVSNITLLSNKMRCRLSPTWFSSSADNSNNAAQQQQQQQQQGGIFGYLCIEFSSLSYMIILREKIIPIISNYSKNP
jgi:hypothetical protein